MTCPVCQSPLPERHFELACRVTRVGDGQPVDYATGDFGERLCSARCALIRMSRLIDDANGADLRADLALTDAARRRVRLVTVLRGATVWDRVGVAERGA